MHVYYQEKTMRIFNLAGDSNLILLNTESYIFFSSILLKLKDLIHKDALRHLQESSDFRKKRKQIKLKLEI